MIFVILGFSGSGKGTQGKLLSQRFGYIPTISTGALVRIKFDENTKEGVEAEKYWSKGKWVPDDLMFTILRRRIEEEDCKNGFILDAFPRTSNQVKILNKYLASKGKKIDRVIFLEVSEEEVVKRMLKRAQKDIKLYGKARRDENPKVIRERLKSHQGTVNPILEEYEKQGILMRVDGERPIGEIHEDIMDRLRKEGLFKNHKVKLSK